MSKQIYLPVPLDHWFKDVKRTTQLREVMGDKALQEAIATLKEVAAPTYGAVTSDNSNNSNRFAWYAGYRDAFNDLHKLTHLKGETSKQPEEWSHIH
tara:strand:- start:1248 stop:1538 length:291 start_codon:yes stop_codon:yes gene_type:complete